MEGAWLRWFGYVQWRDSGYRGQGILNIKLKGRRKERGKQKMKTKWANARIQNGSY